MNETEEVYLKTDTRKKVGKGIMTNVFCILITFILLYILGRILLRGDNVTLIMLAERQN